MKMLLQIAKIRKCRSEPYPKGEESSTCSCVLDSRFNLKILRYAPQTSACALREDDNYFI